MIVTQTTTFNIPAIKAVILTIRETNGYNRIFFFKNFSVATLSFWIEKSLDGGTTWTVVGSSFNLEEADVAIKDILELGSILRVQASGGADDKEVEITYSRYYEDVNPKIWVKPAI